MKHLKQFGDYSLAWSFHRNTSRWAHNAMTSSDEDDVPEAGKERADLPFYPLPEPQVIGGSLHELIQQRCSCRDFSTEAISQKLLATIMHYALGIWGTDYWGGSEFLERPIPSGGGMYAQELYTIVRDVQDTPAGVYHYAPVGHGLEQVREVLIPTPLLKYLFMGQYPATCAAAIVMIAAEAPRSLKKYGDRGYRYLLLEAGHVAQNINLACTGLGLQSLNLGGFFDDELAQLCELDGPNEIMLYAVAIGHGAHQKKHPLRFHDI